jgi:hypothetical protein
LLFQLTLRAYDLGTPERETVQRATVTVNVLRNNNAPQFIRTPYQTTINRDQGLNTAILTVTATDADFNSQNNVCCLNLF